MTASLRSPLIAATAAAAVAAGVVVAVPAGHNGALSQALAAPSSASVVLTAWSNPVNQLLATAELAQDYILGAYYNGGESPTPGAGEANWPFAGFDQTGGDLLNYLLYNEKALGYNSFVGNFPNTTANASPIIQQLQINLGGYLNTALSGLIGAGVAVSTGVWEYPTALLTAAQLALQGQIADAFTVLVDAVAGPAAAAAESLFGAGVSVVSTVVNRLAAVVATLPQILTKFAGWAVAGSALLIEESVAVGTAWLGKLATLDFEGAWNTAVDGLLGPEGLAGTALNLSLGAGVQTGPIVNPQTDIAGNFVPSLRTAVLSAVWGTQDAMSTAPAAVAVARSAAAVQAAPVDTEVASPRAEIAAAEAGETAQVAEKAGETAAKEAPAASRSAAATRKGEASSARAASHERASRAAAGE